MGGGGFAYEVRRAGTRPWLTDEPARYGIKVRENKGKIFAIDYFKNCAPPLTTGDFHRSHDHQLLVTCTDIATSCTRYHWAKRGTDRVVDRLLCASPPALAHLR